MSERNDDVREMILDNLLTNGGDVEGIKESIKTLTLKVVFGDTESLLENTSPYDELSKRIKEIVFNSCIGKREKTLISLIENDDEFNDYTLYECLYDEFYEVVKEIL